MRKACEDEEAITKIIIAAMHRSIDRVDAFFIVCFLISCLYHGVWCRSCRVEIFAPVALGGNIISCRTLPITSKNEDHEPLCSLPTYDKSKAARRLFPDYNWQTQSSSILPHDVDDSRQQTASCRRNNVASKCSPIIWKNGNPSAPVCIRYVEDSSTLLSTTPMPQFLLDTAIGVSVPFLSSIIDHFLSSVHASPYTEKMSLLPS